MISVIAFDYGGVIEIPEKNLVNELSRLLNVRKEEWLKAYFSLNHLCNTGKSTWEEVIALTAKQLGASEETLLIVKNILDQDVTDRKINSELIDIIKKLKTNYKIALLSNYSIELRNRLKEQQIIDLFDELIISGEVGFQKPQPEFFSLLFSKMNILPSDLIFIDDTKRSLEGAESIGYTPLLYTTNEKLKNDLFLLLPQIQTPDF